MFAPVRTLVLSVMTLSGFAFASDTAKADVFDHIDHLAMDLERDSRALVHEFRAHYRHAAHYGHLISDANALQRSARHLHDVAHSGNLSHMQRDAAELDRLFHHLEGLVAEIEHDAAHHHFGHGGHVHGNTRHVRRLMNRIEDNLHHLQDDLRRLQPVHPVHVAPARPAIRVVPGHNGGVSFNNGRFQFRIGF